MTQVRRWHVYPDTDQLYRYAAVAIVRCAAQAIAARAAFHIVLSGGATPQPLYALLKTAHTDWARWHVYFGDERCAPADGGERNDAMVRALWLGHVPIPASQVCAIPAELGAERAAQRYTEAVGALDRFDLVLLGVGEDGHTASLFPHHPLGAFENAPAAVPVHDAPKPPPERVTLSPQRLSRTRQACFLVAGVSKQDAVVAWARGAPLPVAWITPEGGVDILIEPSAMPAAISMRF